MQRGDTIVEVMLSIVIISLVLASAYLSVSKNLNVSIDTAARDQAIWFAQDQVEKLRYQARNGTIPSAYQIAGPYCIDIAFAVQTSTSPTYFDTSKNMCYENRIFSQAPDAFWISVSYDGTSTSSTYKVFTVTTKWQSSRNDSQLNEAKLYYKAPGG